MPQVNSLRRVEGKAACISTIHTLQGSLATDSLKESSIKTERERQKKRIVCTEKKGGGAEHGLTQTALKQIQQNYD
jgi:hypothetical protein